MYAETCNDVPWGEKMLHYCMARFLNLAPFANTLFSGKGKMIFALKCVYHVLKVNGINRIVFHSINLA